MPSRILIFFPHCLYPPRSGSHRRGLELATGFRDLGHEVVLASSTFSSETPWTDDSRTAVERDLGFTLHIHDANAIDCYYERFLSRWYASDRREMPLDSSFYTPPAMRQWFRRTVETVQPDIVMMHSPHWDGLLNHRRFRSLRRIIESHDIYSVNRQMQQALLDRLPASPIELDKVPSEILDEGFYDRLGVVPDPHEFQIYDRYNDTIAISDAETKLFRQHTTRTRVWPVPMTQTVRDHTNTYAGPAFFPTGPNPFNIQGYLYLVSRVLPQIREKLPDFRVQVSGYICDRVPPAANIDLVGYVPDLAAVYSAARFLVCPLLGATGQQIKIVEAMAHGVPVITLPAAAASSPIEHGVNGIVATNAAEFADACIQLWLDPGLCRQLGDRARETIRVESSVDRLAGDLRAGLDGGLVD